MHSQPSDRLKVTVTHTSREYQTAHGVYISLIVVILYILHVRLERTPFPLIVLNYVSSQVSVEHVAVAFVQHRPGHLFSCPPTTKRVLNKFLMLTVVKKNRSKINCHNGLCH